jgi:malate dehydrogenase
MADQKDQDVVRVVITGAAGQIGYSILPLFASGQVFGPNQKLVLALLEITPVLPALNGVRMELDDCAYPLVTDIICTDKPEEAFQGADYAVLVGGFPRKQGMERKDLLAKNSPIFIAMGQAIEKCAKKTIKVLVVANPANTNCLICATNAPSIPKKNFSALTRLDFNRAKSQIATKLGCHSSDVRNVVIWGNHSSTQVPDVNNATAKGKNVADQVDAKWPVSTGAQENWFACLG